MDTHFKRGTKKKNKKMVHSSTGARAMTRG